MNTFDKMARMSTFDSVMIPRLITLKSITQYREFRFNMENESPTIAQLRLSTVCNNRSISALVILFNGCL